MLIAVNGKGGTGKTTVSALLIKHLIDAKLGSLLAVDADPNSNLPEILNIKNHASIVGVVEDISKNMDKIPTGVTKDRFIEMKIQDALSEENDLDLLVMGRPEGPGCYCYVNNLLRDIIAKTVKNYDNVVIDNAAGMEHISRRTARKINKLVFVSDYSLFGVRSAKRIYDLAKEIGISYDQAYLIVNKATGTVKPLEAEISKTGLVYAGTIPYDRKLEDISVSAKNIFEFKNKEFDDNIKSIFDVIMKG